MDLKRKLVEEIHKPSRKTYNRRKVELKGLNDLWQIDIVEMIPYFKENKGFKYILMCINTFSKFGWAYPLKTKTAKEVALTFESILKTTKPPKLIQSDMGKEFYNAFFKSLMDKYKIKHYSTYTNLKASIVERWNRTIKTLLYKEFSYQGNHKWINILPKVVTKYNHTIHSAIKMKPVDVNKKNESQVMVRLNNLYRKKNHDDKMQFKENDFVRISKIKTTFDKGYKPNWSTEIFKIKQVHKTNPITFSIEDLNGKNILGKFYKEELQKTKLNDIYLVEKILRRKNKKYFVKWLGFDNAHNTWINKDDIKT